MNGPDHYRAAERLAGPLGEWYRADTEDVPNILARAQVHATLALAAATALNDAEGGKTHDDHAAWMDVASIDPDGAE